MLLFGNVVFKDELHWCRFAGGSTVVVSAPSRIKSGRELQLPSMSQLTNKTSSQHFFLRILKVIIQLRDAARSAVKKKAGRGSESRCFCQCAPGGCRGQN